MRREAEERTHIETGRPRMSTGRDVSVLVGCLFFVAIICMSRGFVSCWFLLATFY